MNLNSIGCDESGPSVFPCQYHSTVTLHVHMSSVGLTMDHVVYAVVLDFRAV
jgi:hypothetical protein